MGLDQYAYVKTSKGVDDGDPMEFTWRAHSMLHAFMEEIFTERTGLSASDLNCNELVLGPTDIEMLEKTVRSGDLPKYRFGPEWQDEQAVAYRDHDLKFCDWAKDEISKGSAVTYSCWW